VPERHFDIVGRRWTVVFTLPPEAATGPVWVCGDFNDWSPTSHAMVRQPDGSHALALNLEPARSYRFRYFLGQDRWENDWAADDYEPNEHGGADSVVVLPPAPDCLSLHATVKYRSQSSVPT
jgi:1,4-alpha-glucan branching enzyme